MATRLYWGPGAPGVSPTVTTGWELTTGLIRRTLETVKDQPLSAYETRGQATTLNVPAGAVDVLLAQGVTAPLAGNVTIAGGIRGQARMFESNAAGDLDAQLVVWVMKPDGTPRGTSLTFDATAVGHEFNTSLRNISLPKGGSTVPTSVAALTGDRIVVELGYRKHESATTSRTGTVELGNPSGTDLPVDETTTTQGVPWIEFTEALTFADVETRTSFVAVQAAITPGTVETRTSLVVVQVAISRAGAVPGTPSGQRGWGYVID